LRFIRSGDYLAGVAIHSDSDFDEAEDLGVSKLGGTADYIFLGFHSIGKGKGISAKFEGLLELSKGAADPKVNVEELPHFLQASVPGFSESRCFI
jgi:hypothetical protein